ncbi:MAG: beta-1,3-glucanase family protein [Pirellulales bacterium]
MTQLSAITRWLNLLPSGKKKSRRRAGPAANRWKSRLSFETLETREMLATVPVVFSVPADVQTRGVEVAMFATLTADYTPQSGPVIPDGTVVYFDPTLDSGTGDYATATASSDLTFALTLNGQGQATVDLPDAYVKGGQIVIGVGSAPILTFNPASGPTPAGISTPTASTNPTNYFGLFEYAVDASGWNIDLSLVDQIGFPFTITATPAAPAPDNNGVGLTQHRGDLFNLYGSYIASQGSDAAGFQQSLTEGDGYRILAPQNVLDGATTPSVNGPTYSTGGKLTKNTWYYYWVTATNAAGESAAGTNSAYTAPGSVKGKTVLRNTVNLSWTAVEGATGYKIYRSTVNLPTSAMLVGTVSGGNKLKFTDKGAAGTAGTPPSNSYTFNALNSYFNDDLDAFFQHYETNPFSITAKFNGTYSTFTGQTNSSYQLDGNSYTVLALTSPDYAGDEYLIFQPYFQENTTIAGAPPAPSWLPNATLSPAAMVLACDGAFNTGGYQPNANAVVLSGLQNSIVSAFNRGIATNLNIDPNNWANSPLVNSATATSGGSLAADTTYYYVVTANTPAGESTISLEFAATTTATDNSVTLVWEPIDTPSASNPLGYDSYNIYRSTTQGTGYQKLDTVVTNHHANNVTSFVDDGSYTLDPLTTGSPPIYYAPGTTSNWYAAFAHLNGSTNPTSGVSIAGLGYGFAYDDQGGQSSDFSAAAPTQITITLLPWIKQDPPPTPPSPNPHPAPPAVPTSLQILTQPATTKVGKTNTVTLKVFTANGHPFHGGTTVTVELLMKHKKTYIVAHTYQVETDPVTGIGSLTFEAANKGDYMLKLTLEDGAAFYSNKFKVKKGHLDMKISMRS